MEIKKPKTYEEQIQIIEEKGFIISDENRAIDFLKEANYYRLSAYFLPFRKEDQTFEQNIDFDRIIKIYEFDGKMRLVLMQAIEDIELYLRTQIAYYFAHKYGALGYLDPRNFSDEHNSESFSKKIEDCIQGNSRTLVVKHHNEKYNGKFPLWVIIEFFSLGMVSFFYKDLKAEDKKYLAKGLFDSKYLYVESWLRCLNELRNKCAHYSRLYYWNFTAKPKLPKDSAGDKLFDQIRMLKLLYHDKRKWDNTLLVNISALIEAYDGFIELSHIGFPDDWENTLRNYF